jgi:hypothetical protein
MTTPREDGFQSMSIDSSLPPKGRLSAQERDDPFVNNYVRTARRITGWIHCMFCTPWPWIAIRSLLSSEDDDNDFNVYHDFTSESTFWDHCEALSRSSRMLCLLLIGLATCVMTIAVLHNSVGWIVAATAQAMALLYFIYWRRHRLDLSLNRVVRCFANGVALSLALVMAKTVLRSLPMQLAEVLDNTKSDTIVWLLQLFSANDPLWIYVRAFVIVGALEEYLKYKGFDITRTTIVQRQPPNFEDCEALLGSSSGGAAIVTSSGAAITCAMTAVGTGFGWLANCVLVLKLDQDEPWITVGMRMVIPIHSLLAAIQSIGVCCRDLEDNSTALMLTPAILLHGLFEYFLMQFIARRKVATTVWELTASLTTVLFGIAYYVYFAGRQRKRLQEVDQNLQFLSRVATSTVNVLDDDTTTGELVTDAIA